MNKFMNYYNILKKKKNVAFLHGGLCDRR